MGHERTGEPDLRRRAVLAAGGAALASGAGCVGRARNVLGREPRDRLSLRILTLPTDANPFSVKIARTLAENMRAVGIDARIEPADHEAIYRRVLFNGDYDLYVGQFYRSDWTDPDQLYSLLHSVYASEPGWQNPFGYTNLRVDEELERQRATVGEQRRRAVEEIQGAVAETQPFTTLAFPDELTTVRTDRFHNWAGSPSDPVVLLGLRRSPSADPSRLVLVQTDGRITENWNPLAAEFRGVGTVIELLYDPLGRRIDGAIEPWLAADWAFDADGRTGTAELTLREGLTWHDGEPLTADDVAFTYRFLVDTSLGDAESPIPAPRYRGRASLIEEVTAVDDRTVEFSFADASTAVATRAFTVPILPEHVWRDRTATATVAGLDVNRATTEALVWNNPDPVGSGPLRFEEAVTDERLVLSRFDDHFLLDGDADGLAGVAGGPTYEGLTVRIAGSDESAVELVANGDADATVSPLGPSVVPRIGRESELRLLADDSRAFFHVGYNTAKAPLSNPRFRQLVARLIDKHAIARDVFEGYARPAASPLAGTDWLAPDLAWSGTDPALPFFGDDGELDAEAAREAFVEAGYQYRDGKLLGE